MTPPNTTGAQALSDFGRAWAETKGHERPGESAEAYAKGREDERAASREQAGAVAQPSAAPGDGQGATQYLFRIFNLGWSRGHEEGNNEWGDWELCSREDAEQMKRDDENNVYEFVPYVLAAPGSAIAAREQEAPLPALPEHVAITFLVADGKHMGHVSFTSMEDRAFLALSAEKNVRGLASLELFTGEQMRAYAQAATTASEQPMPDAMALHTVFADWLSEGNDSIYKLMREAIKADRAARPALVPPDRDAMGRLIGEASGGDGAIDAREQEAPDVHSKFTRWYAQKFDRSADFREPMVRIQYEAFSAALASREEAPAASAVPNAELLRGWKRYEKLRKLTPAAFNRLHIVNVTGGNNFDDLVDALPEPSTPIPEQSAKGLTMGGEVDHG